MMVIMMIGDGIDDDDDIGEEEDTVPALPERLHASQHRRTR